jgi:hypothetical protein
MTLIISVSIMVVSCTKTGINQDVTKSSINSPDGVKPQSNQSKQLFGFNWVFDDERLICHKCPLDCLDPIIIYLGKIDEFTAFNALNEAVNSNNIRGYFTSDYWSVIFPGLNGTPTLDSLQSGHYGMLRQYNSTTKTYFYLAGNILPVTPGNREFVMQVQISD